MAEAAIFSILTGDAAVAALIVKRCYYGRRPQQGSLPAVSFELTDGDPDRTQDGASDLMRSVYRIDCWANGVDAAAALMTAVRRAINNFAGAAGGQILRGCFLSNIRDIFEPVPEVDRRTAELIVWHKEA